MMLNFTAVPIYVDMIQTNNGFNMKQTNQTLSLPYSSASSPYSFPLEILYTCESLLAMLLDSMIIFATLRTRCAYLKEVLLFFVLCCADGIGALGLTCCGVRRCYFMYNDLDLTVPV